MPLIEFDDIYYAAEMTNRQFLALDTYLTKFKIIEELQELEFLVGLQQKSNYDKKEIKKWLLNSWNTEFILRVNLVQLNNESLRFAVQWGFPQTYYSIFASTLAYFIGKNYTERSHRSVRKKFSRLIEQDKYPESVSFYCNGFKDEVKYFGIQRSEQNSSLSLNTNDQDSVETQISQFLKSTREIFLENKREKMRKSFRTQKGKVKQKLTKEEWGKVNSTIHNTTILDLLYRKRIKSNYRDIDTFQHENIDPIDIFSSLLNIVDILNLIHETYIAKIIGLENFQSIISENKIRENNFLIERVKAIKNII